MLGTASLDFDSLLRTTQLVSLPQNFQLEKLKMAGANYMGGKKCVVVYYSFTFPTILDFRNAAKVRSRDAAGRQQKRFFGRQRLNLCPSAAPSTLQRRGISRSLASRWHMRSRNRTLPSCCRREVTSRVQASPRNPNEMVPAQRAATQKSLRRWIHQSVRSSNLLVLLVIQLFVQLCFCELL